MKIQIEISHYEKHGEPDHFDRYQYQEIGSVILKNTFGAIPAQDRFFCLIIDDKEIILEKEEFIAAIKRCTNKDR
jgi:hypothetical protein